MAATVHEPFLQLEPGDGAFWLPITDQVAVGPVGNVFMFGGVGLAAAIEAAELSTGRTVVWSSAQFVSYARIGETLKLTVEPLSTGRNTSQVRVVGSVGDKVILCVSAALGDREGMPAEQWLTAPEVPPPSACPSLPMWPPQGASLMDRLEVRVAHGALGPVQAKSSPSDGRLIFWGRTRQGVPLNASILAIFADFVPSGVSSALARPGGGSSLDNTLRFVRLVPTEWILCDVRITAAARGFAHGAIYLFAQDGTMLASGSQSVIVRFLTLDPLENRDR